MEDAQSVASVIDSTSSKTQELQRAFAELESHQAITLNIKWKELEDHFHGLEKFMKRRFHELEDIEAAAVVVEEWASLERHHGNRDAAIFAISNAREKLRKVSSMHYAVLVIDRNGGETSLEEKPPDSGISEESTIEDLNTPTEDGSAK